MKNAILICAGFAVAAALMRVAFHGVEARQVLDGLGQFDWVWAPALIGLPVMDLWVRAARWRVLLEPLAPAGTGKLLQLEAIGLALNNLLVMRLGEVARALLAGLELDIHAFAVLATVAVERLCDVGALLALFAGGAWASGAGVRPALLSASAGGAVAVALVLAVAAHAEGWLRRTAAERLASWPLAARLAEDLAEGARGLRRPGAWWRVGLLSLGLWVLDAALYWSGARALRLSPALDYGGAVVLLTTAAAFTALPAMPGGFGNFEAAVRMTLRARGVAPGAALAYAASVHLVIYAVVTTLGLVFIYRLGHTVDSLKKAVSELRRLHG